MDAHLKAALSAALGREVVSARAITGGDINRAYELVLVDGQRFFAKANDRAQVDDRAPLDERAPRDDRAQRDERAPRDDRAQLGMFAAEARGLAWLREAGTLRIPEVVAVSRPDDAQQFLVLAFVATGAPAPDFDEQLGHGLAALHRHGAPGFGLDHDNFIGWLPQANAPTSTWAEFYRTRRLEPLLRRAIDEGLASSRMRQGFARLFRAFDELVGPAEPAARLHGDLWEGNLICDDRGGPCLIDPAVYGGHREIDLAMMRLFGGFDARVFDAYGEAWPLADGHRQRVPLYQLYPLMAHVNLFGGGYVASVEAALGKLA